MYIAVIGHGLSPIDRSWGFNIDTCNVIVRMWNWYPWQNEWDYGLHYDVGFLEIHPGELSRFNSFNTRTPSRGWVGSKLKPCTGPLPAPMDVIDPTNWEHTAIMLGGMGEKGKLRLTRGVRAAAYAIEYLATAGDTVVLVGFDNVYFGTGLPVPQAFPKEYLADPAAYALRDYVGGSTKYSNHDYAIERPFLNYLARANAVHLQFAQDIWA